MVSDRWSKISLLGHHRSPSPQRPICQEAGLGSFSWQERGSEMAEAHKNSRDLVLNCNTFASVALSKSQNPPDSRAQGRVHLVGRGSAKSHCREQDTKDLKPFLQSLCRVSLPCEAWRGDAEVKRKESEDGHNKVLICPRNRIDPELKKTENTWTGPP